MTGSPKNVFLSYLDHAFVPSYYEPEISLTEMPDMPKELNLSDMFKKKKEDKFFNYFTYF